MNFTYVISVNLEISCKKGNTSISFRQMWKLRLEQLGGSRFTSNT